MGQLQCRLGDCRNPGFFHRNDMLGTLAFTGSENWDSFTFPRGQPCALVVVLFSNLLYSGLLIFRVKKSKILRDFQGQIRGKIGRFHGIFAEKKSKFTEKSADFTGFSREKSQNSQKNRPISQDFSGQKSNFEGLSGANS